MSNWFLSEQNYIFHCVNKSTHKYYNYNNSLQNFQHAKINKARKQKTAKNLME